MFWKREILCCMIWVENDTRGLMDQDRAYRLRDCYYDT